MASEAQARKKRIPIDIAAFFFAVHLINDGALKMMSSKLNVDFFARDELHKKRQ